MCECCVPWRAFVLQAPIISLVSSLYWGSPHRRCYQQVTNGVWLSRCAVPSHPIQRTGGVVGVPRLVESARVQVRPSQKRESDPYAHPSVRAVWYVQERSAGHRPTAPSKKYDINVVISISVSRTRQTKLKKRRRGVINSVSFRSNQLGVLLCPSKREQ